MKLEELLAPCPKCGSKDKVAKRKLLDNHRAHAEMEAVKCSECGNTLDMHGVNAGRGDANFCPNCGTKMDKGE